MGYDARINYMMTWLVNDNQTMSYSQEFWFILAGPLETILTGTIGFLFLYKSAKPVKELTFKQWCLVFLSLFWLRQPANFAIWISGYAVTGRLGLRGDEITLSDHFHWPAWWLVFGTALIGFLVLAFVVSRFIPKQQRLTFILAGLTGGISGYALWLGYFGKIIMP
jgi:hypothetical protein